MGDKLKKLKEIIEEDAKQNNQEVWFFPEYKGIKGFLGTQDIILLGLNPSSGTFPSDTDKLLYNLLKQKGFSNIHITDFIKVRAKNEHVTDLFANSNLIKKQTDFFSEEFNIIKPKIIITMGLKCDILLKKYFPKIDCKCKIIKIKHPGFRWQKREEVFAEISKSLEEIKKEYEILCKK
jgi:hypothetical protein